MRVQLVLLMVALFVCGTATARDNRQVNLAYTFAEVSMLDFGGDGGGDDPIRISGSYDPPGKNWVYVGGVTSPDGSLSTEDAIYDIGASYVHHYKTNFDLIGTARLVTTPDGAEDDYNYIISGGFRKMVAPKIEIHGTVNRLSGDNSDTYMLFGGDYYISDRFSAGVSVDLSETDSFTIGARYFFK